MRHLLLAAGLLAVASCRPASNTNDPPDAAVSPGQSGPIALRLDRSEYRPGEQPRLTVINAGAGSYAWNPCTRTLERRAGSVWEAADPEMRMCTMEAWILRGADSTSAALDLPQGLAPGVYRVRLAFTADGAAPDAGRLDVASPPFTIRN